MPWAEFMELGLGAMRMTPDEFWNCSFIEFYSAIDGFRTFNGADRDKPMTRDELDELMELNPD